jgi:hypothetical protein
MTDKGEMDLGAINFETFFSFSKLLPLDIEKKNG